MKRYSVSRLIYKGRYIYSDRTDDPAEVIKKKKKSFNNWRNIVSDENNEFHDLVSDCIGIRIVDSQTKEVVFEKAHFSEELGLRKVYERVEIGNGTVITRSHFEKIQ